MSNVIQLRLGVPKLANLAEPVSFTIHDTLAVAVRTAAFYQSQSPEKFLHDIIVLAFPEAQAG